MTAICAPAMYEAKREHHAVRWCFKCRARHAFDFVIWQTVEPSYWGPVCAIQCTNCGSSDSDLGFGRSREWDYE